MGSPLMANGDIAGHSSAGGYSALIGSSETSLENKDKKAQIPKKPLSQRVRPQQNHDAKNDGSKTERGRRDDGGDDISMSETQQQLQKNHHPKPQRKPLASGKTYKTCSRRECRWDGVPIHDYQDSLCIYTKATPNCCSKVCTAENGEHPFNDCPRDKDEKANSTKLKNKSLHQFSGAKVVRDVRDYPKPDAKAAPEKPKNVVGDLYELLPKFTDDDLADLALRIAEITKDRRMIAAKANGTLQTSPKVKQVEGVADS